MIVPAGDVEGLRAALDRVVLEMPDQERRGLERRGRDHATAVDRFRVFDDLFRGPRRVTLLDGGAVNAG